MLMLTRTLVWSLKQARLHFPLQPSITLAGHVGFVRALALSNNDSVLATGGHDRTIRLWRMPAGLLFAVLKGHTDFVRAVAFSSDGTMLVSGSGDGTVRVWRVPDSVGVAGAAGAGAGACAGLVERSTV
jgi:WD40 repeat protein